MSRYLPALVTIDPNMIGSDGEFTITVELAQDVDGYDLKGKMPTFIGGLTVKLRYDPFHEGAPEEIIVPVGEWSATTPPIRSPRATATLISASIQFPGEPEGTPDATAWLFIVPKNLG
ncbi:MAG: hypothetical protein IH851_10365 [Armatimonadetes bacterium]|nr:hypothetical protein [Armatimonadota bacterium]